MSKLAKYLALFLREAAEHLTSLQQGLLLLEQQPENGELVQDLMRNAHTVKGSARMLGLEAIGTVAHRMEDLFKAISEGEIAVTPAVIDLLLAGSDMLGELVAASERGDERMFDLTPLMLGFDRGELERPVTPAPAVVEPPRETAGSVRVSVDTLERMSRYFGELELVRQRLVARLASLQQVGVATGPDYGPVNATLLNFEEDLLELETLLQDVAVQNRKLRMLPLRTVTDGVGRVVRDLARTHGKEVRVAIEGDELEIDRLVLDDLRPAFIHLLTNALAHGIESPADRTAAGKPPAGELRITARQEGETIAISLRDDGRGMDPALIRAAAVRQVIVTADQAAALSDEETLYLTLRHGFSTETQVGSLSGRGVGLDVVAEQIRRIKGRIILGSEPGRFCEVTLQLPRSLMSLEGVVISCGGERYIIPTAHVVETLSLCPGDFIAVDGSMRYVVDPSLQIIHLADLLGLPAAATPASQPAIVLRHRDRQLLCLVDAVQESLLVVVLRLSNQFASVWLASGVTLLTDGQPVLILNVQDLFATVRGDYCPLSHLTPAPVAVAGKQLHILVVDDSVTSRNLEATILRAQGYLVSTAESGAAALGLLEREQFDLVVSDFEMPLLDGIELTRRLRERYPAVCLPVMMVSSLASDEDRRQAFAAGVQAYMVKGEFDQDLFLATIHELTTSRTCVP